MSSQDFNTFKIYMKVARELQTNNPIISYYLKAYALNKAVEYLKIERSKGVDIKEKTVQIKDWLQDLEELKAQLSSELTNKEQCKRGYQTFAYGLYEKSDKEYRNGNFTRNLAKDFLYVSVLFDAWELSGGQPEDVKNEKNYANQARFQIIEIIDQGKNQPTANTASPTANPAYKDAHSHIRPPTTPTGDTDTTQKKNDTVDPLAKLNFDLTESIVVPKSTIDKFLDGTRPEVKVAARAVLDSLTTESPKGVQTSPMNANKTPNNPLGLPIGTSVRIDDTVGVNGAQNAIYPNPSNIGFMQNMNIGQGQYPNLCMPNTGFPVVQRQHPQSQFQMVAPCNQPGYPNFGQNYPQSTFQCKFNQQVQPNVLRELQNRAEPSVFGGNKEQQKGNSENMNNVDGNTKMKCQEAKTLCLKAANELDLANIKEAKEKIWKALSILEEMEDRQGQ